MVLHTKMDANYHPLPIVALASFGLIKTGLLALKFNPINRNSILFEYFAVYALIAPIALIIIKKPIVYDGWRHFYFLYFPVVLLAILGFSFLEERFKHTRTLKLATPIASLTFILFQANWIIDNHPHQNVYFNAVAGKELANKYELDYWGVGNFSAIKHILDNDSSIITISAVSATPLENALLKLSRSQRSRVQIVTASDSPKYLLTNYRGVKDKSDETYRNSYDVYYRVIVDETNIITIYKAKQAV